MSQTRGDRLPCRKAIGLRRILVVGAVAVLRYARQNPEKYPWLAQLLACKPFKAAAVALANKMHASPGHCWPRVALIGHLRLWQRRKGVCRWQDELRLCVHELQG